MNELSSGRSRRKIVAWLNQLERINTNGKLTSTSTPTQVVPLSLLASIASSSSTTAANTIVPVGTLAEPEVARNPPAELCFRAAQLLTELLLMLFAGSLLLIAAIVLASPRVPPFMATHYELLPKILFFLCLFVAAYSLVRWLSLKIITWRRASSKLTAVKSLATSSSLGANQAKVKEAARGRAESSTEATIRLTCQPPTRQVSIGGGGDAIEEEAEAEECECECECELLD